MTSIFACRFRTALADKGLKQKEFAEQSGISLYTLNKLANAKALPSTTNLIAICKSLGVSADYLLGLSRDSKMQDENCNH